VRRSKARTLIRVFGLVKDNYNYFSASATIVVEPDIVLTNGAGHFADHVIATSLATSSERMPRH